MRTLGIVLAKGPSSRIPTKNLQILAGKEMFLYPVEILRTSGICHRIVVSTDSEEVREIAIRHGVDDVVMRNPEWDNDEWQFNAPIHGTIEKCESNGHGRFDACAMILGNSIFVRPSWFRCALDILSNYRHFDMQLTHVYPVDCVDSICIVFRIHRSGLYFPHRFPLPHVGINLDIDYPEDLELARSIMERIDYPLIETKHDTEHYKEMAIRKANTPRIV